MYSKKLKTAKIRFLSPDMKEWEEMLCLLFRGMLGMHIRYLRVRSWHFGGVKEGFCGHFWLISIYITKIILQIACKSIKMFLTQWYY